MPWLSSHPRSVDEYAHAGTLIELHEAHLHSHSARSGRTEFEDPVDDARQNDNDDDDQDDEDDEYANLESGKEQDSEAAGMLPMSAAEYTIEGLRREVKKSAEKGQHLTEYQVKAALINKAVQDIGWGSYQNRLFWFSGFGWFADNIWMQGISLTLPSLSKTFDISDKEVRSTTTALFLGLCVGSLFWGMGMDIFGRKLPFSTTLLITFIFGALAAFPFTSGSWGWVCLWFAMLGTGVGGSLPVDGAVFMEFLPESKSHLLTFLSIFWPVGQLFASLLAWYCMSHYTDDMGWRALVGLLALTTLVMAVVRFSFRLQESPKFLLSKGRQSEAVLAIYGLAYANGKKTWLTDEIMDAVADSDDGLTAQQRQQQMSQKSGGLGGGWSEVITNRLKAVSLEQFKPLFANKALGWSTVLIWISWACIGMGYPLFNAFLPQYLARTGASTEEGLVGGARSEESSSSNKAYINYLIISAVGAPGSVVAAYAVQSSSSFLGRKGTLCISTCLSAIFLFLFVAFGTTPNRQLAITCFGAFFQNIMYAVLYAYTPEIFPAHCRGTGAGVASFLNRVLGLLAPILASSLPGDGQTAPIYIAAALIFAAFLSMIGIPIETRGRQTL